MHRKEGSLRNTTDNPTHSIQIPIVEEKHSTRFLNFCNTTVTKAFHVDEKLRHITEKIMLEGGWVGFPLQDSSGLGIYRSKNNYVKFLFLS